MEMSRIMATNKERLKPLVYVSWVDAAHPQGIWQNECEEAPDPVLDCETAGFLIKETKTYIVVAAAIAYHEDVNTPSYTAEITIPRKAIHKLITLQRPKSRS